MVEENCTCGQERGHDVALFVQISFLQTLQCTKIELRQVVCCYIVLAIFSFRQSRFFIFCMYRLLYLLSRSLSVCLPLFMSPSPIDICQRTCEQCCFYQAIVFHQCWQWEQIVCVGLGTSYIALLSKAFYNSPPIQTFRYIHTHTLTLMAASYHARRRPDHREQFEFSVVLKDT